MADKSDPSIPGQPNPFDVVALGDAVNDSASRVSTIWISFLIFALYLLTAASTVTHRQLFLADPIKLPVLNIDLPLWGFFFLAPILFVIFHIYVLLQVLLLAHTAAAYNDAVERLGFAEKESASLRQRLANTLFAQIFAGAPRERSGWIGWMLQAIAWITLAIAPILILVVFQFSFLAYHSHLATWTHRLLILSELAVAFVLWPLVLDARQDFEWATAWTEFKRTFAAPLRLLQPQDGRHGGRLLLRQQSLLLTSSALFLIISLSLGSFPGEPHINLFTGHSPFSVECDRWLQRKFDLFDLRFDRLDLPHVDVIDHEKLEKIEEVAEKTGELPNQSDRTRIVRGRDLNCGDFSNSADLRRVDLSDSRLVNVHLQNARLQGASLDDADLRGASLALAELQGASFDRAKLQGASLDFAQLQGSSLDSTELQGASFSSAQLQGASLVNAGLQGAFLNGAKLVGAAMQSAKFQGAFLVNAQMQGALLRSANFQAASLQFAQIQGADFSNANLDHSDLSGVSTWRATNADCKEAKVNEHNADAVVDAGYFVIGPFRFPGTPTSATSDGINEFIDRSVAGIPNIGQRKSVASRLHASLDTDATKTDADNIATLWSDCEGSTHNRSQEQFEAEQAVILRDLVCDAPINRLAIAGGVIQNWINGGRTQLLVNLFGNVRIQTPMSINLARRLLGLDGKWCMAANDFDENAMKTLREATKAAALQRASQPESPAASPRRRLSPPTARSPTPPK